MAMHCSSQTDDLPLSDVRVRTDGASRPTHERAFLILVVSYPADDAQVPVIDKKPLEAIATYL